MGGTSVPEDYARLVKTGEPDASRMVGAVAVFQKARVRSEEKFVPVHEIVHVLTGDGTHNKIPGNLMNPFPDSAGLTKGPGGQCERMLASPFVRDGG
jgi:hypothetical protein